MFRKKENANDSINKYKARLMVKGYAQAFGVNYFDTICSSCKTRYNQNVTSYCSTKAMEDRSA